MSSSNPLSDSVVLPCGRELPNRIVKAPMAECLATFGGGHPREEHASLYETWARGGWAMVITGKSDLLNRASNVQISPSFLATPWDLTVPPPPSTSPSSPASADVAAWTSFAARFHASSQDARTPLIVQLSHPGRQSPLFCRSPLLARPPSASEVRVHARDEGPLSLFFSRLMFQAPVEMTDDEVDKVCERFGQAAGFLESAGVDGVEIHGAHGYLVAQFLSPATNLRAPSSRYSLRPSSPSDRPLEILWALLLSLRRHTSRSFCVGIKLSCGDFVRGGLSDEDALDQVRTVREMTVDVGRGSKEGWDFVEISGGAYENPLFATTTGPNVPFVNFTTRLLALPVLDNPNPPLVVLSSSLRSLSSLTAAVSPSPSGSPTSAHLLAFARPSILHSSLPSTHLAIAQPIAIPDHSIPNGAFWSWALSGGGRVGLVGAGLGTIWWDWQMARVGRGLAVDPYMGVARGFVDEYGLWLVSRLVSAVAIVIGGRWAVAWLGAWMHVS